MDRFLRNLLELRVLFQMFFVISVMHAIVRAADPASSGAADQTKNEKPVQPAKSADATASAPVAGAVSPTRSPESITLKTISIFRGWKKSAAVAAVAPAVAAPPAATPAPDPNIIPLASMVMGTFEFVSCAGDSPMRQFTFPIPISSVPADIPSGTTGKSAGISAAISDFLAGVTAESSQSNVASPPDFRPADFSIALSAANGSEWTLTLQVSPKIPANQIVRVRFSRPVPDVVVQYRLLLPSSPVAANQQNQNNLPLEPWIRIFNDTSSDWNNIVANISQAASDVESVASWKINSVIAPKQASTLCQQVTAQEIDCTAEWTLSVDNMSTPAAITPKLQLTLGKNSWPTAFQLKGDVHVRLTTNNVVTDLGTLNIKAKFPPKPGPYQLDRPDTTIQVVTSVVDLSDRAISRLTSIRNGWLAFLGNKATKYHLADIGSRRSVVVSRAIPDGASVAITQAAIPNSKFEKGILSFTLNGDTDVTVIVTDLDSVSLLPTLAETGAKFSSYISRIENYVRLAQANDQLGLVKPLQTLLTQARSAQTLATQLQGPIDDLGLQILRITTDQTAHISDGHPVSIRGDRLRIAALERQIRLMNQRVIDALFQLGQDATRINAEPDLIVAPAPSADVPPTEGNNSGSPVPTGAADAGNNK